ncbi:MAG: polymer-forming cytoskeletal protein [Candidatus Binatia bacterium]
MWRWRGNHSQPEQATTSVIDKGCEVNGRLVSAGTLVVHGKFQGELLSSENLLVGETGRVEAEVQAGVALVSGHITGTITARERVELRATARVFGDILTPVLVLEEGVVFDGHCKMKGGEVRAAQKSS